MPGDFRHALGAGQKGRLLPDPQNHRLLRAIQNKEGGFDLEGSWKTVGDPRYLEASPDGRQLAVSGTWSRQIQIMNVPGDSLPPELLLTLDLSFNPGPMVFVPDEKLLLVMHAFGGLLAWVELDTGSVRSVVELPMNNFGRPKIQTTHQGPVLWLAGQSLNPRATTFQTEVMWGVLMDNQIRSIPVSLALDPMTPVHQMGRVYGMGDETGPGGDPGSVWSTRNGTLIAALEGWIRSPSDRDWINPAFNGLLSEIGQWTWQSTGKKPDCM